MVYFPKLQDFQSDQCYEDAIIRSFCTDNIRVCCAIQTCNELFLEIFRGSLIQEALENGFNEVSSDDSCVFAHIPNYPTEALKLWSRRVTFRYYKLLVLI